MKKNTPLPADEQQTQDKRKKLFMMLGAATASITLLGTLYYYLFLAHHVTTDNAYVNAEIAQVTPSTGGIIKQILVNDTDTVKTGDVLVIIDDMDAQLSFARAKADLAKAQVDLERTKTDYDRRLALEKTGSVSGEEISNARNAYKAAQATFDAAHVAQQQAQVDLDRITIRSPVDGVIAKRMVQLGQRIQAGAPLMSVVPIHQLHVDANFKEVQLRRVRVGQPVYLTSDIHGKSVIYRGTVAGVAGGTGAAFSLIPAQNATGNWIKVVQRLPVRITLDPEDLKKHPLQVGLSMTVDIDVSDAKK